MRIDHPQSITTHRLDGKKEMHPLSMKDRDPCVRLSEQRYSSRHLNRARHMDPKGEQHT
jgi:hypothetical protein